MTLDNSQAARIGALETSVAKLEQRTDDLTLDVRALAPLVISHAEMRVTLTQVTLAIKNVEDLLKESEQTRRQEVAIRAHDERANRWKWIGFAVALASNPIILYFLTAGQP